MTHSISSKILLFGEYSVVVGGSALAMPFPAYGGSFQFASQKEFYSSNTVKWSNQSLKDFALEIGKMMEQNRLSLEVNLPLFEKELEKYLFFDSNIPKGYGLGSSGAVVAGIVKRYAKVSAAKIQRESLGKLQQELSILESYFHGQSSGFDPLICYLNQGILKTEQGVQPIEINLSQKGKYILFLLDTELSRKTEPLVQLFLSRLENEKAFDSFCKVRLKPKNAQCIAAFLQGKGEELYRYLHQLSLLQWHEFQGMIPQHLKSFWKRGLESNRYSLKLCGAGGGGCMLGMTMEEHWRAVQEAFGEKQLKLVCKL